MEDLKFVRRCLRKERKAWDEFIQRFSGLIYSYILSVFKSKTPHHFKTNNIEDAFQDFFIYIRKNNCKKLRTFQGKNGCTLASWLRQVVINFSLDYIRGSRGHLSLDQAYNGKGSIKDTIFDQSDSIKDKMIKQERITRLRKCVQDLTRDQRLFLELHLNKGVAVDKLARLFRVSRGAIDMRKSRIIEALRRRLFEMNL